MDDRHHALVLEEVEAVQQEGEVGRRFGGEAVILEPDVIGRGVGRLPFEAEGRIGHNGVKGGPLGRVQFTEDVPLVEQGVAVEDLELRVLHPMQ